MAAIVGGVIGILLGAASIPMMGQFYADLVDSGKVYTNVKIGAGSTLANETSMNTGGHKPNIALWGNDGHRIGRYRPHKKDYIPDGTQTNIKVEHGDTDPPQAAKQPEYILVEMNDDDAICVNYIAITGPDNNKMGWYGDVGFSCGADWYHSQYKIGDNNYMPRCTWLDKNHSNNLRFQGMGIHITDFNSNSQALAKQYQDHPDSMCKTAPRFKMYESIKSDDVVPIYFPPLTLNTADNTDVDPVAVASNQGVPGGNPAIAIPGKRQIMDSPTTDSDSTSTQSNSTSTRQTNNAGGRFDGHLIVSHHEQHSAVELCEAHFSVGPDFISIHEEIFCDMYTKHTWPLCTDSLSRFKNNATMNANTIATANKATDPAKVMGRNTAATAAAAAQTSPALSDKKSVQTSSPQVAHACFDIETKTMRSAGPHRRDAANGKPVPDKLYDHSAHWQ